MIIRAEQKNIPSTPRKLHLVAYAVKKMTPVKAVALLDTYNNKAARQLSKVIKQALANATNNKNLSANVMRFEHILVGRGISYKRFLAGARGRAKPYEKTRANVTVILSDKGQPVVATKKTTEKTKSTKIATETKKATVAKVTKKTKKTE